MFPIQKWGIFRKIKEIKGLRVPPGGREQGIAQIDAACQAVAFGEG
jgi:hypothetical protein